MSPLEWLRRQRPPLSPRHRARFLEVCDAVEAAIRVGEGPAPVAIVQIDDVPMPPTNAEAVKAAAEQIRAAIAKYPPPPPRAATFASVPMLCPCVAIYTRCHYPDKHGNLPR